MRKKRCDEKSVRFLPSIILLAGLLILSIILSANLSPVSSQETSYCCEQTKTGAWCQNAPLSQCNTAQGLRAVPTACESTSYCQLGWCYDSQEGICMENTPQKVCEIQGGVWEAEKANEEVPLQCTLGCCLIGDQAAFVTQVRCKKLSATYGLETNFRSDINNEALCVAQAQSSDLGACVFEKDFERTCKFTTRTDCNQITGSQGITNLTTSVSFHKDFLCSSEALATNCGPTEQTTCVEGKDEVYFVDSCGNRANIYDASKIKDKSYWEKIVPKDESCGGDGSNSDSKSCGNCNYFLGSICKNYKIGTAKPSPQFGDNICRNLDCNFEGQKYKHGESWCANAPGIDKNSPGSRYFKMLCFNNEVTVEACADFRQEVCLQDNINGYKNAQCRANEWQDCFAQTKKDECENEDKRDCVWQEDFELASPIAIPQQGSFQEVQQTRITGVSDIGVPKAPITGAFLGIGDDNEEENKDDQKGACIPKFPPGANFWSGSEANQICALANYECIVKYETNLLGQKKCVENCDCIESGFEAERNALCTSLGDCGNSVNYLGYQGYGDSTLVSKKDEKDVAQAKTRGAPGTTTGIQSLIQGLLERINN